MVDRTVLAGKIAAIRDAVARIVRAELAERMAAASGLRNLVAHRYGALDWNRIHEIASTELDDLLAFCEALAQRATE